jgi:hypothetical protein
LKGEEVGLDDIGVEKKAGDVIVGCGMKGKRCICLIQRSGL